MSFSTNAKEIVKIKQPETLIRRTYRNYEYDQTFNDSVLHLTVFDTCSYGHISAGN